MGIIIKKNNHSFQMMQIYSKKVEFLIRIFKIYKKIKKQSLKKFMLNLEIKIIKILEQHRQ